MNRNYFTIKKIYDKGSCQIILTSKQINFYIIITYANLSNFKIFMIMFVMKKLFFRDQTFRLK